MRNFKVVEKLEKLQWGGGGLRNFQGACEILMGVKKYSAGGGGVKNYSGALINLQGVGKLSVCVENFQGGLKIFFGG